MGESHYAYAKWKKPSQYVLYDSMLNFRNCNLKYYNGKQISGFERLGEKCGDIGVWGWKGPEEFS